MNDDQITSLAREYAEWVTQQEGDKKYIPAEQAIASAFLHWLTRRFCLVEKENIKKCFQSRNYILTHQDKYEVYIVRESEVEMKLLRCLFPEIAKEVVDGN